MFLLAVGVIIGYETGYQDKDSLSETVTSIFQWLGGVVAGQVMLIVIWEGFIMVMAERLKKRYREEGREEGRKEGQALLINRLTEDQRRQLEEWLKESGGLLNEPSPQER